MERLTYDGNFCDIAKCEELLCEHYPTGGCSQRQVWERLKEYEDTGITPEEAIAIKHALMGKSIAEVKEFDGVPLDRLRELAQADKEGRLVVLPAKTVYGVELGGGENCDMICPARFNGEGVCGLCEKSVLRIFEEDCKQEHIPMIGKTVFLTREEAEEALKEQARD